MPKVKVVVSRLAKAILCDKDKDGHITGTPSFAKIAFWFLMIKFIVNPDAYSQWWFYTAAALLSYILFGSKFIPAFLAAKGLGRHSEDQDV